jgi:hypothetical protein
VATFTQLASGNWRVQVRRNTRHVAETFRRRKDAEEWALDLERNIDRNGSSKPRVIRNVRTFGDLIDLHDDDIREVGKPPRRSKAAVMASLKTELGSVKLPALNRERLVEFGRKRAKQGAGRGDDSLQYRCGALAANDLDAFIARRPVDCLPMNLDQYGRTVATCSTGGVDLGEWLVSNGLALDWPHYSKGRYKIAQHNAERAGRGLWKGSYVEPWLYRVGIRAQGRPANCSDDANAHPTSHVLVWTASHPHGSMASSASQLDERNI